MKFIILKSSATDGTEKLKIYWNIFSQPSMSEKNVPGDKRSRGRYTRSFWWLYVSSSHHGKFELIFNKSTLWLVVRGPGLLSLTGPFWRLCYEVRCCFSLFRWLHEQGKLWLVVDTWQVPSWEYRVNSWGMILAVFWAMSQNRDPVSLQMKQDKDPNLLKNHEKRVNAYTERTP